MKKRIMSIVLALIMVAGVVPIATPTVTATVQALLTAINSWEGLTATADGNVVTVTGSSNRDRIFDIPKGVVVQNYASFTSDVSISSVIRVRGGGTFELMGDAKIHSTTPRMGLTVISVSEDTILNIKDNALITSESALATAIFGGHGSTINIYGGTIESTSDYANTITIDSATLNVYGGTITAIKGRGGIATRETVSAPFPPAVNLYGGTIKVNGIGDIINGATRGTVTIDGKVIFSGAIRVRTEITPNGSLVIPKDGMLEITTSAFVNNGIIHAEGEFQLTENRYSIGGSGTVCDCICVCGATCANGKCPTPTACLAVRVANWQHGGNGSLRATVSGNIITVSGSVCDAKTLIGLEIPRGVTIKWQAEMSAIVDSGAIIAIIGDGVFELDGGSVTCNSTAFHVFGSTLRVARGSVSNSSSSRAILVHDGLVTVGEHGLVIGVTHWGAIRSVNSVVDVYGSVTNTSASTDTSQPPTTIWASDKSTVNIYSSATVSSGTAVTATAIRVESGSVANIKGGKISGALQTSVDADVVINKGSLLIVPQGRTLTVVAESNITNNGKICAQGSFPAASRARVIGSGTICDCGTCEPVAVCSCGICTDCAPVSATTTVTTTTPVTTTATVTTTMPTTTATTTTATNTTSTSATMSTTLPTATTTETTTTTPDIGCNNCGICEDCNPDRVDCDNCDKCKPEVAPNAGKLGHVLGNATVGTSDALEILKYIVKLPTPINTCNNAKKAATIMGSSITTADALEILKHIVKLPNKIDGTA